MRKEWHRRSIHPPSHSPIQLSTLPPADQFITTKARRAWNQEISLVWSSFHVMQHRDVRREKKLGKCIIRQVYDVVTVQCMTCCTVWLAGGGRLTSTIAWSAHTLNKLYIPSIHITDNLSYNICIAIKHTKLYKKTMVRIVKNSKGSNCEKLTIGVSNTCSRNKWVGVTIEWTGQLGGGAVKPPPVNSNPAWFQTTWNQVYTPLYMWQLASLENKTKQVSK